MGAKQSRSPEVIEVPELGTHRECISELATHPVYLLAAQINRIRFAGAVSSARFPHPPTSKQHWMALQISIRLRHRLNLVSKGRLYVELIRRLAFSPSGSADKRVELLKLANCIASLQHFCGLFFKVSPECSLTLRAHDDWISSVAFHPSGRYLATCSYDKTVKLWRLDRGCNKAECVSTIEVPVDAGRFSCMVSAVFHPSAPFLAVTGANGTSLWRLDKDCSEAKLLLRLNSAPVKCVLYVASNYVAFHPSAPYLATAGADGTSLWRLSKDCTEAQCVSLLQVQAHADAIHCVAFHPSAPLIATGSGDGTAKFWRLNQDRTASSCILKQPGHEGPIHCVAFHSIEPFLATAGAGGSAKLWRVSLDFTELTHLVTLQGHSYSVYSVAFHPSAPILATGSGDGKAKLWLLNSDSAAATCVATLQGRCGPVRSVAFHPLAVCIATGSDFGGAKLWQ